MNNRGSKVVSKASSISFDYELDYKLKYIIGADATAVVKVYVGNVLEYFKSAVIVDSKVLVRLTTGDNYNLADKLVTIKVDVINTTTGVSFQVYSERYSFTA